MSSKTSVRQEDQEKINKFAKLNVQYKELKDDISSLSKELSDIKDAQESMEEFELMAEGDEKISYKFSDVFLNIPLSEVNTRLEKRKGVIEERLINFESQKTELESETNTLKTALYARFGSQINLEADED